MALSSSLVSLGVVVGIFSLLALGLNVKFGYTGLLDIGHVAFFLVGAYLTALLVAPPAETQDFATYILGWSWPWIPAVAAGTVAAGLLGLLVALPAIRLREDYLAIAVLGISVILRRIVQSEGWLANGPDSLRGYPLPLRGFFPLPGSDPGVAGALLFGLVVAVLWTAAAYALAATVGGRRGRRGTAVHALFALTTLGIGYAASRLARDDGGDGGPDIRMAALGGLAAGVVAAGGVLAGLGVLTALVFLGFASLFTWSYGGLLLVRYYRDLTRRDAAVGLALAVALLVVFGPLIALGSGGGVFVTVVLLAGFLYGVYYLGVNWETVGTDAAFVRVVGLAAVWLFLLRYFVLSLATPFSRAGVAGAVSELLQDLLWMARFSATGVELDYQRFLLVATFALVGACYYLLELTVNSPFGRVLTAIREDEDVATALGKNTFAYKVQSMVLGSAIAGLAGGVGAIHYRALTHNLFHPRITFIAFLIVIIGGVASNRGAILGAVVYWAFWRGTVDVAGFFPTGARASVQALRLAVFGALFILVLYYRPQGLLGERRPGGT